MQFGIEINPMKPLVQEIESMGKWGLDFVEICIEPPLNAPALLAKKVPLIKKALNDNNMFAMGHAHPWCDLGSPDVTVRAAWLVEIKQVISAAAKLGLRRLDVHAHSAGVEFMPTAMRAAIAENLVSSFGVLIEAAKPHGLTISMENTWESPKEFTHLLSKVKGLSATVDIGHAFMRGRVDAIREFLAIKEVGHLHIHDAKDGTDHLALNEGDIPFKLVAALLKKRDYQGTAAMEIFAGKSASKQSLDKFREIIEKYETK